MRSSIAGGNRCVSSFSRPSTIALTSITRGLSTWRRLKASNCLVSDAAFALQLSIASTWVRMSRGESTSARERSSLTFDAANPEAAQLVAVIAAQSVSTGNDAFDDTLRGGNWFAADRHPQIVFESHDIEITGEQTGIAHGELTIRGVTHAAEMHIEFYGGNFNFLESRDAIGFGADMMVSRSDYGIGQLIPAAIAGDDVRIRIEAEFLRED